MSTISLGNTKSLRLAVLISQNEHTILDEWLAEMRDSVRRGDLIKDSDLRSQCAHFLRLMREALESAGPDFRAAAWDKVRDMLNETARSRAQQGFTPSETASFIFSVKRPLFTQIRDHFKNDSAAMAEELWSATELLDAMGLYT